MNVEAVGWGRTAASDPKPSDDLRKVGVPIVDDRAAAAAYPNSFDAFTMVGAGLAGRNTCTGDSGGPLLSFASTPALRRVVGLTSYGACGGNPAISIYSRVAEGQLWRWITEQIPTLGNDGAISRSGDFNRDGKDDIVTFVKGLQPHRGPRIRRLGRAQPRQRLRRRYEVA